MKINLIKSMYYLKKSLRKSGNQLGKLRNKEKMTNYMEEAQLYMELVRKVMEV
jgi:hypothetical protein